MAPVSQADHDQVEQQLKNVIQDLYNVMLQVNSYDITSRPTKDVLESTLRQLDGSLLKVHTAANHPAVKLPSIPPELIGYIDNGRNPDIYTREFVELARRQNQLMKGKMEAFASFRDILAEEMGNAMEELKEDVGRVVEATGGDRKVLKREST